MVVASLSLVFACTADGSDGPATAGGDGGSGAGVGVGGSDAPIGGDANPGGDPNNVGGATNPSGGTNSAGGTTGAGASTAGGEEPPELAGTLAAHNAARATKGLTPLSWDPALSAIAATWAAKCIDNEAPAGLIDHNPGRRGDYPDSVGENIYASSGSASGPAAVESWMGEGADYDEATGNCAEGKVCGHYTQVMWSKTTKLGCALYSCAGLKYSSTVVCNYATAGNNGDKAY